MGLSPPRGGSGDCRGSDDARRLAPKRQDTHEEADRLRSRRHTCGKQGRDRSEMATLFAALLDVVRVASSRRRLPQFKTQVIAPLTRRRNARKPLAVADVRNPLLVYDGGDWKLLYAENFTAEERKDHRCAQRPVDRSGFKAEKTWGEAIEDRESQITYSRSVKQRRSTPKKNGTRISASARRSKACSIRCCRTSR